MAKAAKFRRGERVRFKALGYQTQEAMQEAMMESVINATMGDNDTEAVAAGECLWAGIRAAVKATVPGLQDDVHVDACADLATAAFLRTMRRRIKRPNPRRL